uniref:Uncharacterized protein n=1 Tax=Anguilla anguilla TaxID=7936 RepID=A0A0E9SRW8_ANGAN
MRSTVLSAFQLPFSQPLIDTWNNQSTEF